MEHSKKRQLRSRERHAPTNNTSHSSYVSGLSTTYTNMDGGNMPTGSATILGSGAGHFCGRQVANIGDFNKDGFPDFAFGCHGASVVYVIFGKGTGFDTAMDLAAFQTGMLPLHTLYEIASTTFLFAILLDRPIRNAYYCLPDNV